MIAHASDCALHNAPALPVGPCDCGAAGWHKISDRPEWDHQPIYQFIRLEGARSHSGERWARVKIGTATIERDGPFGYREADIDRLCRDGDMDRETAQVTHWMPAIYPALSATQREGKA